MSKKNGSDRLFSPISIDLGAVNTGVSLFHADKPWNYCNAEHRGILYYASVDNITFSQQARRAKRHMVRARKRQKMAKKLVFLILKKKYRINFDFNNTDDLIIINKIRSLMNRRGYTFLTLDDVQKQKDLLEEIIEYKDDIELAAIDTDYKQTDLRAAIEEYGKSPEKLQLIIAKLQEEIIKIVQDSKLQDKIKSGYVTLSENDKKKLEYKEIGRILLMNYLTDMRNELTKNGGHKHRTQYIKNIEHDVEGDETFKTYFAAKKIKPKDLLRIIAHVNNLQLRVLRKYFNNKEYTQRIQWEPERFHKVFTRWVRGWHVVQGQIAYKNKKTILDSMQQEEYVKDPIQFFLKNEPAITIPPFEDQNNRRPPVCQSVLLNVESLDKRFPEWQEITKKILQKYAKDYNLAETDLRGLVEYYNKKPKKNAQIKKEEKSEWVSELSIQLHRILDASAAVDPLHLRLYARGLARERDGEVNKHIKLTEEQENKIANTRKNLAEFLNKKEIAEFENLLVDYYDETRNARAGIWRATSALNLLSKCERKPRQKKNERATLIHAITGIEPEKFPEFEQLWIGRKDAKIGGFLSLHSYAGKLEEFRKNEGGGFKLLLTRAESGSTNGLSAEEIKKIKELKKLNDQIAVAAKKIGEQFNLGPYQTEKFNNWFSFTQIYNIMEGESGGFHKNCHACAQENQWRMQPVEFNGNHYARATRLSNDSGRPFDGQLKKLLERLAEEIAKDKTLQLQDFLNIESNAVLEIPIIIEQNKFEFQYSLQQLKKAGKKNEEKAEQKYKNEQNNFSKKNERIKLASKGICAYTGESIPDGYGEIDHIVPRSYSRDYFGTVFNTEMNLIYVSRNGNQAKGNRVYSLENLHRNYLSVQYPGFSVDQIKSQIETTVDTLLDKNEPIVFDALSEEMQRDLRHSLLHNNLRAKVGKLIVRGNQTIVNGTQLYFTKVLMEKLEDRIRTKLGYTGKIDFYTESFDPLRNNAVTYRDYLAASEPVYKKEGAQGFASHILDAVMLLAEHIDEKMSKSKGHEDKILRLKPKNIKALLPGTMHVKVIQKRPKNRKSNQKAVSHFKDSMYAERYLPLIVTKEGGGFGFHLKNYIEIGQGGIDNAFAILAGLIEMNKKPVEKDVLYFRKNIKKGKKFFYFPVNRKKAAQFLFDYRKGKIEQTKENKNLFGLLNSIQYTTMKTNIVDYLTDDKSRKKPSENVEPEKLNKPLKVTIKKKHIPKLEKTVEGLLALPVYSTHWEKILNDKNLKASANSNTMDNPELWEGIQDTYFKNTIPSPEKKHKSVRKVYSLPIVDGPSGGIVFRRKSGIDGNVYQLQAIDGEKYSGFANEDGKAIFKKSVLLPHYLQSPNIVPLDEIIDTKDVVKMYETRKLECKKETLAKYPWFTEMWITPATDSRRLIEVTVSLQKFFNDVVPLLKGYSAETIDSLAWTIPAGTMKLEEPERNSDNLFNQIDSVPRERIRVLAINRIEKTITFQFSRDKGCIADKEIKDALIIWGAKSIEDLYNASTLYR